MNETWVVIDGYPNYKISDRGRVFSIKANRLLKCSADRYGYPRVNLEDNGVWRIINVHRLVAFAFVPGYFPGACVNHIDGNKQNNKPENLEWVTHTENVRHAYAMGLNPTRRVVWKKVKR